jgi:hypothetical protein
MIFSCINDNMVNKKGKNSRDAMTPTVPLLVIFRLALIIARARARRRARARALTRVLLAARARTRCTRRVGLRRAYLLAVSVSPRSPSLGSERWHATAGAVACSVVGARRRAGRRRD